MDEPLDSRLKRVVSHASHPGDVAVIDRIAFERVGRARAWRLDAISVVAGTSRDTHMAAIFRGRGQTDLYRRAR